MSIFVIVIIASNTRLATAGSGSDIPSINARGTICQENAVAVPAPATSVFRAAVADDGVPQAVGFGLVVREDLERHSKL